MAESIFPSVQVTQIRSIAIGNKILPQLTTGIAGAMFKRLSETHINGYAIAPETAPSIAVNITNTTDSQYIDYNSVEVKLVVNSTDGVVALKNVDSDVIEASELIKSGLEISNTYGFYKAKAVGSDFIFYPSTGASTVFGAAPGDWLYRLLPDDSELLQKIKQVVPTKLSKAAFPAPTSSSDAGATFVYVFDDLDDLTDVDNSIFVQHQWLIAIKKLDKSVVAQYHINAVDNVAAGKSITVDDDITSDALIATGDIPDYDWYVYDMPFGSLRMYGGSAPTSETTTSTSKYSIYNFPLRISEQGGSAFKFGRFVNPATSVYIFNPDARNATNFVGVRPGDYLEAIQRASPDISYRFRISKVGSSVLKGNLNAPDTFVTDTYTFPSGTSFAADEYVVDKSYLVAQSKEDATSLRFYKITAVNTLDVVVDKVDFSTDGAGANNGFIATGDVGDYNWFIYDMPPNSLLVDVTTTSEFVASAGENSVGFDFKIVNAADYYVSGRNEVTILNHISDDNNDEIGLADVVFTYNVLETENAGSMININSQTAREAYCGVVASYNPLGLAAGMHEINSAFGYKVFPTNIAFSERDPDNPFLYTGRFVVNGENLNYHDVTKLDWDGVKTVISGVKDTQIPYYIVPLSDDASVQGMFNAAVGEWAEPIRSKEMLQFGITSTPTSETVMANINGVTADFSIVDTILRWKPTTRYVSSSDTASAINFLSIGVKKNDYMSFVNAIGAEEVLIKVRNIYPTYIDLGVTDYATVGDLISAIDSAERITIKKVYANTAEQAEALVKIAEGYADPRMKILYADAVDLTIEGTTFISMPTYFAAAGYAALATSVGTTLPKTRRTINGISRVYRPAFTDDELEIIGSGYLDILEQDFDGGPVYSKRQFMSDGSELSGIEPIDELAKYLRLLFRPIVGKNNINRGLFDFLSMTLSGAIETFVPSKLENIVIKEGFRVSGVAKDRVSLKLFAQAYKALNGIDIELYI